MRMGMGKRRRSRLPDCVGVELICRKNDGRYRVNGVFCEYTLLMLSAVRWPFHGAI